MQETSPVVQSSSPVQLSSPVNRDTQPFAISMRAVEGYGVLDLKRHVNTTLHPK